MRQMVDVYDYYKCSVLGVQQVPREDTRSYGIVDSKPLKEGLEAVHAIVEKPKPEEAPSTLAVVGRYVLTPRIVGDRIGLHPVAVIFAVMAGGQLFGFLGMLLALPAAAVINVLLRYAHERYRESELYAGHAPAIVLDSYLDRTPDVVVPPKDVEPK